MMTMKRRPSSLLSYQYHCERRRRHASTRFSSSSSNTTHTSNRTIRVHGKHRSNLLFGANTNVGKTVVAAGLTRASLLSNATTSNTVQYLKPLQTGGVATDQSFVERYTESILHSIRDSDSSSSNNSRFKTKTLFSWNLAASPHTSSRHEHKPVSDEQILTAVEEELATITSSSSSSTSSVTWIETAGGVLSPSSASPLNTKPHHARARLAVDVDVDKNYVDSWGWTVQADLYQPLLGQLPVVLVGDGRLGGISATLTALESLLVRGYDVSAIVLLENTHDNENNDTSTCHDNVSALREYATRKFALRSGSGEALFGSASSGRRQGTILKQSIVSLPPLPADSNIPLDDWYQSAQVAETFASLNDYLQSSWEGQVQDLSQLRESAANVVWWPFTQHGTLHGVQEEQTGNKKNKKTKINSNNVTLIDSASGDQYNVLQEEEEEEANETRPHSPFSSEMNKPSSAGLHRVALFDACASWWTQGLGHGNASQALAVAAAAGRYGHVLFAQVAHAPAVTLSQKLLAKGGPGYGWADRAFYTDNGSTAMEVAIKMGMKLYQTRMHLTTHYNDDDDNDENEVDGIDWVVCAQEGCYHGDTLGAMNVAEPSIFNQGQHPWYEPKGLFLETPTLAFQNGVLRLLFPDGLEPAQAQQHQGNADGYVFDSIQQALDVEARCRFSTNLFSHYKEMIEMQWLVHEHVGVNRKIGSVVLEPILMGAGGMKFVDPLWQRALMAIAESRNVPVIFDEIASGLHRVGVTSCREILKADPDIACYAKLLTGGVVPMAVTLASKEVFDAFVGDEKGQALLHGHSYTANPVGCVSAIHALDAYKAVLQDENDEKNHDGGINNGPRMLFDVEQARQLSLLPLVETSFTLGTVLAVTIRPSHEDGGAGGYGASSRTVPLVNKLRQQRIFARPLGNVIYIMASPVTSKADCARLADVLYQTIEAYGKEEKTI